MRIFCFALCLSLGASLPLAAAEPAKTYRVPYRLTETKHTLVRAKINGQGPYNFILDTGAPALFVATSVCKKIGVRADNNGWGTFDRFEIEGGVVVPKARGRVEDPFQLEGMNGLGLAGAELHGIIGYTILARYRLEFDFTKDKMGWTPLDFRPPPPLGLDGPTGAGGLEALGPIMKMVGALLGKKSEPSISLRGFLGIELEEQAGAVRIKSVLAKSPAAAAGLEAGDKIQRCQGKPVRSLADFQGLTAKLKAGDTVELGIDRDAGRQSLRVTAGEGL